eukprot:9652037-Alexandrium_andersonii.AAC.1
MALRKARPVFPGNRLNTLSAGSKTPGGPACDKGEAWTGLPHAINAHSRSAFTCQQYRPTT